MLTLFLVWRGNTFVIVLSAMLGCTGHLLVHSDDCKSVHSTLEDTVLYK
jgi:hypothetical protein